MYRVPFYKYKALEETPRPFLNLPQVVGNLNLEEMVLNIEIKVEEMELFFFGEIKLFYISHKLRKNIFVIHTFHSISLIEKIIRFNHQNKVF